MAVISQDLPAGQTQQQTQPGRRRLLGLLLLSVIWLLEALMSPRALVQAAVLPEDELKAGYHAYDGGGVEVNGPVFLVRKNYQETWSLSAQQRVDSITSASVDVLSTASKYSETRTETNLGADYLVNDSILGVAYSNSTESDYDSDGFHINYLQELAGNATRINLGASRNEDQVGKNVVGGDADELDEDLTATRYRLGLAQILSQRSMLYANYEATLEEGFLSNPYRVARIGAATVPERLPETRTSQAVKLSWQYYLPAQQASVTLGLRYFWDSWAIRARTLDLSYVFSWRSNWLVSLRYRGYGQSAAEFYADRFSQELNFMSRDKELSRFTSQAVGLDVEYFLPKWRWFDDNKLYLGIDYLLFDYENFYEYEDFTDVSSRQAYDFDALVVQTLLTLKF